MKTASLDAYTASADTWKAETDALHASAETCKADADADAEAKAKAVARTGPGAGKCSYRSCILLESLGACFESFGGAAGRTVGGFEAGCFERVESLDGDFI